MSYMMNHNPNSMMGMSMQYNQNPNNMNSMNNQQNQGQFFITGRIGGRDIAKEDINTFVANLKATEWTNNPLYQNARNVEITTSLSSKRNMRQQGYQRKGNGFDSLYLNISSHLSDFDNYSNELLERQAKTNEDIDVQKKEFIARFFTKENEDLPMEALLTKISAEKCYLISKDQNLSQKLEKLMPYLSQQASQQQLNNNNQTSMYGQPTTNVNPQQGMFGNYGNNNPQQGMYGNYGNNNPQQGMYGNYGNNNPQQSIYGQPNNTIQSGVYGQPSNSSTVYGQPQQNNNTQYVGGNFQQAPQYGPKPTIYNQMYGANYSANPNPNPNPNTGPAPMNYNNYYKP